MITQELFITLDNLDPAAYPVVGVAVSSTSVYYSKLISGRDSALMSLSLDWTGTPTGTLTLWGSNVEEPDLSDDSDWFAITWSHSNPAGSADSEDSDVAGVGAIWRRVKYVNASGSGVLSGRASVTQDFDKYASISLAVDALESGTGITDDLDVPGDLTVGATVDVTGTTLLRGNATIGNADTRAHRINGDVAINAAAVSGTELLVTPSNSGTTTVVQLKSGDGDTLTLSCSNTATTITSINAMTVVGATTFNDNVTLGNGTTDLATIKGELDHDGTKVGLFGTAPVVQPSAIAALTGNSGGSANDALETVPDPGNTPADADALRDDLVANVLPKLRNNIDDVMTKVNAITAALRALGVIAT